VTEGREGLWRPEHERDACGVGLVAALDGEPRRQVVELALAALASVGHRGAVDADGRTGDGAGLMVSVPHEFFHAQIARLGCRPTPGAVGVGQIFLPRTDLGAQDRARTLVETELVRIGARLYGWRQTPVQPRALGAKADATRPEIAQILFCDPLHRPADELERLLTVARRRVERRALELDLHSLYICSLSARTVVYKGLFLAAQIAEFYEDLRDERFVSPAAVYHQRYSTNTFPEWRLAHPFRMLAHNGEINTLKGNVNWMRTHEGPMSRRAFGEDAASVLPIIQPGSSDSAALDAVYELVVRGGLSVPFAKVLLVPEAWSHRQDQLPASWSAMYHYCNALMEPWDGPAALVVFDGRWAVAGLDRNGLRPLRWALTLDGLLSVGSEAGLCPLDPASIVKRGAVPAGRMIGVDLQEGHFYDAEPLLDSLARARPFEQWMAAVVDLDPRLASDSESALFPEEELRLRQRAAGLTLEDLELILQPMGEIGAEATGSMGDDTPLAVLSERYRPLSHFFRQDFSQVTNPPIDPLRERRVMSLKTRFGNLGRALDGDRATRSLYTLSSPILTNRMFDRFSAEVGADLVLLDATYGRPTGEPGESLRRALEQLRQAAVDGVRAGATHVVLSDRALGPDRAPLPGPLAVAAVHTQLVRAGLRSSCSLNVRTADALDPHSVAVLIGVGATTVNPYLALDSVLERVGRGLLPGPGAQAVARYKAALEAGLLKIMSKLGISVLSSYRGGGYFEALGLSRTVLDEYFLGVSGRISGLGLPELEARAWQQHTLAFTSPGGLPTGGFYRQRSRGERHAYGAMMVHQLQKAVREDDFAAYLRYVEVCHARPPMSLRDLLEPVPLGPPVPLEEVEPASALCRRLLTPGMSLGALSPEAHGTLNVAMNRLGARSVSGEGGEDPRRYARRADGDDANSAVKQVASGRFGVTAEYLNQCREIEIKIAQGAKPGEGGQLPASKVTELVARLRHASPGATLISPPPHHDIYSIEDLAQLVYDLKQINPDASVGVKLVAGAGVGAIAAGVVKARADTILICGSVGGTGASAQSSIKFAGLPWELGLAEVNQTLTLNGLRHRVRLRTDGGLRTGRDIVLAALLGAEEFGIGTLALVALGCLIVRQCHSNTCPVGICTQDEALRKKFAGEPEHVVRLMTFLAEEVRGHLARLGVRTLEELVGRPDKLVQREGHPVDCGPLLVRVDSGGHPRIGPASGRVEVEDTLDAQVIADAPPFFRHGAKVQLSYPIRNAQRAVGARISSRIVRRWGMTGLPEDQLTLRLRGTAGQSLGAFAVRGLRLEVDGEANDFVGKGLSGATIVVRPSRSRSGEVLLGNTCLYGATQGYLFAAGRAGERFAVRNSGAVAVIEGCGANGCEYMTGGEVIILGPIGENFGAGMTGGRVWLYDPQGSTARMNPETIRWGPFRSRAAEQRCRTWIERHVRETRSLFAESLLAAWPVARDRFVEITAMEAEKKMRGELRLVESLR
jgi:glutamate synthase (NADPH/NADH) large chain